LQVKTRAAFHYESQQSLPGYAQSDLPISPELTQLTVYLKQNMANAKAACPGQSHGEVMRGLSKRWAEGLGDHEEYWKVQAGLVKV